MLLSGASSVPFLDLIFWQGTHGVVPDVESDGQRPWLYSFVVSGHPIVCSPLSVPRLLSSVAVPISAITYFLPFDATTAGIIGSVPPCFSCFFFFSRFGGIGADAALGGIEAGPWTGYMGAAPVGIVPG